MHVLTDDPIENIAQMLDPDVWEFWMYADQSAEIRRMAARDQAKLIVEAGFRRVPQGHVTVDADSLRAAHAVFHTLVADMALLVRPDLRAQIAYALQQIEAPLAAAQPQ